ncbi:hypothetical protein IE53DRAFT_168234 [Violaceomyces palustris]|uniref:Uncharacterized protein n=1 Tax=Violaceomyces palustris TaxID=1673888 RepID=A0ACD0P5R1_9BASI|nr:hypothetical protein IE53DRAFT_168234 [Violaceomyces palustris]
MPDAVSHDWLGRRVWSSLFLERVPGSAVGRGKTVRLSRSMPILFVDRSTFSTFLFFFLSLSHIARPTWPREPSPCWDGGQRLRNRILPVPCTDSILEILLPFNGVYADSFVDPMRG